MRKQKTIFRLAIDSMMAALYFVLAFFSIRFGNITISMASLTILLVSLLYSPMDALAVALIGELINQTARYGFTPTTALWIIPVLARALILSVFAHIHRKKGSYLECHVLPYYLIVLFASLITTVLNTGIIFLDGYLMNYPVSFTLIETGFRFLSSVITSIIVSSIGLPILKALDKIDVGRIKCDKKDMR